MSDWSSLKASGNTAFAAKEYAKAKELFTSSIEALASDASAATREVDTAVLLSNRSACHASLGSWEAARTDAERCTKLRPDWSRGFSRLALATLQLKDYVLAEQSYRRAMELEPGNAAHAEGVASVAAARKEAAAQSKADDNAAAKAAMEDVVIGIDLGTTYSCVAVWRNGQPEVLTDASGNRTVPSWVSFDGDRKRTTGHDAKRDAARNPQRTLFNVKRLIGRDFDECGEDTRRMPFKTAKSAKNGRTEITLEFDNETKAVLSAEQVSAMVLEHMKAIAERSLGHKVKKAVITVPAYFNDAQRRLTKDAGAIAGLDVLRIINEPTAAALAYGLDKCAKGSPAKKVLVFDLGGGTFDVSLLDIHEGMFEVIATAGDTHLGGEDFDAAVADWVRDQHRRTTGKDPLANDESGAYYRRLRAATENAKRELSGALNTLIEVSMGEEQVSIQLSRAKFESLNERTFQRCLEAVKRVLADSKISKAEVDEIVLVGGSTRVPRIQAILSEFFNGKTLCKSVNPDEAVAVGAAVQGAILANIRDPLTQALLLVDVTPLSLGVGCEGNKYAKVVPRNTQVPCKMTSDFTTVADNQTEIDIDILEGESPKASDNHLLGSFKISGVQRAKQGVPKIDVTFEVSTEGILHVSARDRTTGAVADVNIQHDRGRLAPEEVERMIAEAEAMRREAEAAGVQEDF